MNLSSSRRDFMKATATTLLAPSILSNSSMASAADGDIVGHGSHRYKIQAGWGKLDAAQFPVKNCHQMVMDSKGRLIIVTHETKNNNLRTRIGQSLIYEVKPLDDDARAEILATLAARRGLRLADEVVDFLLRHGRRELSSLREVLDALDRASLEHKRPITLPLLRDMIQQGLEI